MLYPFQMIAPSSHSSEMMIQMKHNALYNMNIAKQAEEDIEMKKNVVYGMTG